MTAVTHGHLARRMVREQKLQSSRKKALDEPR